ncbi:hypothetical protein [Aurantiacibacter luteus]|uniref:DUF11 domain-containing protein n=1 Tax=Aurantiacibacter luteus TaxID=1581420 RepID=A0A0G9N215_9SPHN|nr:hypothetical protein [Aurantiacibacter luteus]KLE35583.1 hypothetical protein AAW00_03990 [Aurantiacibacter luteus]
MKILKFITSVLLFAAAPAAMAQDAAQPITLEADVKAVVETTAADGTKQVELVEPGTIVPGDRLVFGTNYMNGGTEPFNNFVMTNPLPAPVRLAPDADADLVVSVDGGTTWGRLAELAVANEDGTSRPAEHRDVTHIRWTLAVVETGASGRFEYPAIIR